MFNIFAGTTEDFEYRRPDGHSLLFWGMCAGIGVSVTTLVVLIMAILI